MILIEKINLYRNILPYRFVHKEKDELLLEIEKKVSDFLVKEGFYKSHYEEISHQRFTVLKNKKATTSIIINKENHITITSEEKLNTNLKEIFNKATELEKELSKEFNFAFSSKFGYLTPDPSLLPYAMDVEVIIYLPYIEKNGLKNKLIENLILSGYKIQTNSFPYTPSIIHLQAKPDIDSTIDLFLTKLNSLINSLESEEDRLFENSMKKERKIFLDKVKKTLAYLNASSLLDLKEAAQILLFLLYASSKGFISCNKEKAVSFILNLKEKENSTSMKKTCENAKKIFNL